MIAEIKGSLLRIEQQEPLIQGTVGQTLGVRLSEEWAGLTVTAVFSAGSVTRDVVVAGDGLVIPWELLAEPEHALYLNFHGAAPGGSPVRRTNIASLGTVEKSRSPSGTGPDAPSPSRADQIQALAEQALSLAQSVRDDADSGRFDGQDGADGQDGLSPSISVSKTGDTAVITVTDASGSASVSVKDGREVDLEMIYNAYPHDTASGAIANFPDGADGIPAKSLVVDIAPVQTGSGDPSPDNIRPISGWTGVNVSCTGRNLLDTKNVAPTAASSKGITAVQNADGSFNVTGTATGVVNLWLRGVWGSTAPIMKLYAGKTYYIRDVSLYNSTTQLGGSRNIGESGTYTPNEDTIITGIRATTPDGTTLNTVMYPFITDDANHEWQPFGTTYSITFPSEAGTVYGGTLNVTTGLLTVTHGTLTMDGSNDEGWGLNDLRVNRFGSTSVVIPSNSGIYANHKSNYLTTSAWGTQSFTFGLRAAPALYVCLDQNATQMTVDQFNAYLASNPLTICYELAAPITYQLTPTEVRTLLGTNNIWADTGNSDVEYRADPTLYLDRRLTASRSVIAGVESGLTASRNYASGSLLIVGDTLYKLSSPIENGGAIQPGVNAAATTVAEQLLLLAAL